MYAFYHLSPAKHENGFVKGEVLGILRTSSKKVTFEENISKFKRHLRDRGEPSQFVRKTIIRNQIHKEGLSA